MGDRARAPSLLPVAQKLVKTSSIKKFIFKNILHVVLESKCGKMVALKKLISEKVSCFHVLWEARGLVGIIKKTTLKDLEKLGSDKVMSRELIKTLTLLFSISSRVAQAVVQAA